VTLNDSVTREVDRRLGAIEAQEDVKVLFACESGSRAWGFASADSDFDVRFLYVRPLDWYLAIDLEHRPDVIESMPDGVWDVTGWDLRKALRLFRKSNPPLLEWLHSPTIYRDRCATRDRLVQLLSECYSPQRAMYHYLHMAAKNHRVYLQGDSVWLKKYFYVLRPLLACHWIEAGRGIAPVEFERLLELDSLEPILRARIAELLEMKRSGVELARGPRIPEISRFLEAELPRLEGAIRDLPSIQPPVEPLNSVFLEILDEAWER
jgi:predicted nucleotidyltransferase